MELFLCILNKSGNNVMYARIYAVVLAYMQKKSENIGNKTRWKRSVGFAVLPNIKRNSATTEILP